MVDTRAAPDLPPGLDCLPPTQDDLPYDDGVPLESNFHVTNLKLLVDALELHLEGRRAAFVGSNMFVYFSPDQLKTHDFRGPDFFVVLDVPLGLRKSWVVWQEDGRVPNLVIEILSPSTSHIDRNEKRLIYQNQLRVQEYILFDPDSAELLGYYLENGQYQPIVPEPDGSLVSRQLDLKLVVWEGEVRTMHARWLRWANLDGALLPSEKEAFVSERQRADALDARAEASDARAAALEAELARYRARFGDIPPEP